MDEMAKVMAAAAETRVSFFMVSSPFNYGEFLVLSFCFIRGFVSLNTFNMVKSGGDMQKKNKKFKEI